MEKKFELTLDAKKAASFRNDLRDLLAQVGLIEKKREEVILAVDEALTNIIRHAYAKKRGKVRVDFRDYPDRIEITIRDYGKKFDLMQVPTPELPPRKPGGLGVYFIRTLMDKACHDPGVADGNQLCLTKLK